MRIISLGFYRDFHTSKRKQLSTSLLVMIITVLLSACAGQSSKGDSSSSGDDNRNLYDTVSDAFSMHDSNNDGNLDRQEFIQFQQDPAIVRLSSQGVSSLDNRPGVFEEMDENGDGNVSLQEIRTAISHGGR